MIQTMTNNLDILHESALVKDKQVFASAADDSATNDAETRFNIILDKTIEKSNCTLGDIKNNRLFGDMSEKIANFKEILIQATKEVNMENSLDLTLARDITEIISQLKTAIHPDIEKTEEEILYANYDSDMETNNDENNNDGNNDSKIETNSRVCTDEETDSGTETSVLPVFEQILTMVSNFESNDINCSKNETQNTEIQKSLNTIFTKAVKPAETALPENNSSNNESEIELDRDMLTELNIESVTADTDFTNDSFTKQEQSPEEYSVKVMLNNQSDKFEINFEKPISTQNSVKSPEYSSEKIIEQITKHFDSLKPNSKINIVLNPESLGKVNLQILNSKDGLSAQFTVTTNDARELLMKGLDGLKEALLTHGINVDNISVKISEAEESYNPDWTEQENSEGRNKEQQQQKQEKEKGLFEKTIAEELKNKNGNV